VTSADDDRRRTITIHPPLDGATAAALLEICAQLQAVLWRVWGAEIEDHWSATEPGQLIYGPLHPPSKR
jgi:hypothetical protein